MFSNDDLIYIVYLLCISFVVITNKIDQKGFLPNMISIHVNIRFLKYIFLDIYWFIVCPKLK